MADLADTFERLRRPFPTSAISWRVGSSTERDGKLLGMPLAYIDARDVMDRLDDVVGIENWQARYPEVNAKTICSLGIRVNGEWLWKEDGAGDTDYEAEKGALSDAFKRAGVRWGIGRYLYGLKAPWVEVERKGPKTIVIPKSSRGELDTLHDKCVQDLEWGDRLDRNSIRLLSAALAYLDTNDLETFEKAQEGTIALLPVAARENLRNRINVIGRTRAAREEAA